MAYGTDLADGSRVDLVRGDRVLATSMSTNGAYVVAAEVSNDASVAIRITAPDGKVDEWFMSSNAGL